MTEKAVGVACVRVLCLWCLMGVLSGPAEAKYGGGVGLPGDPFLINTTEQLWALGTRPEDWHGHFRLMADLDLSDGEAPPLIGTRDDGPFTGTFDGNHKTVSNLSIRRQSLEFTADVGLFGWVDGELAQIRDLVLIEPNVLADVGQCIGSVAGRVTHGSVVNCHVRAANVRGNSFVGGIVGRNDQGRIVDCTATAVVSGVIRVGGIVGQSYYGRLENCRAMAEVQGLASPLSRAIGGLVGENSNGRIAACHARCTVTGDTCVGGLAGDNPLATIERSGAEGVVVGGTDVGGLIGRSFAGTISDCYSQADVTGGEVTGGLIGRHGASCYCKVFTPGSVARCYAAGPVAGGEHTGGLIGLNERSLVEDSFWDMQVTAQTLSDGGEGRDTWQLYSPAVFAGAGWDLAAQQAIGTDGLWRLEAGRSYPRLAWEPVPGDFNGDGRTDLRDYAVFSQLWRQTDTVFWSTATHLTLDGIVDLDDLTAFSGGWLARR